MERDGKKRSDAPRSSRSPASGPPAPIGDGPVLRAYEQPRARVRVNKAYKMFVGGAFVRSESGRYFQVRGAATPDDPDPEVVNVPRASRKDVRDAVLVAKNAAAGWANRTPFNRGQILYRLAEVMESRRGELTASLVRAGLTEALALAEVDASIDRAVYYAGFADKFQSILASSNPVAGPHFTFSVPEPMGVVAVLAPALPALLGLVSTTLPIVTAGNAVVVVASERDPRTAVLWTECLATSDWPAGVLNVLTGHAQELAPVLARHREVAAIDAWSLDADLLRAAEEDGAGSVKRVKTHAPPEPERWIDEHGGQGLGWIERFLETKTIWHPVGV